MNYQTKKRSRTILFAIVVIMLFAIAFSAILVNSNKQSAYAQGGLLEESNFEILNNSNSSVDYELLTWDDFEYLFILESEYRSENPEVTPDEMIAYLESEIENIIFQKQNSMSLNSYPTDVFGLGLTSMEILWFTSYPAQGIIAYNASVEASAKIYELYVVHSPERDNVNYNAFKHSYWNALMEKRISKNYVINGQIIQIDFAEGFATAHEHGWDVIYPKSTEMDLLNNALGRSHGATYGHLSDHDMALKLAGRIASGEFYRIPWSGDLDYDRVYGTIVPTN